MCSTRNVALCVGLSLLLSVSVIADDIDIFQSAGNASTADNVLLLLDNSNSMRWGMKDDSIMLEQKYYDAKVTYEGSHNAPGGLGDPDYVYFYRWIDHYFAVFDFVNKVPRSSLVGDCANQKNTLDPAVYDDDDDWDENPFTSTGTYSNLLQDVYQINLADGTTGTIACSDNGVQTSVSSSGNISVSSSTTSSGGQTTSTVDVNGTTVTCGEGGGSDYTPNQGDQYVFLKGNDWAPVCEFTDDDDDDNCPLNKEEGNPQVKVECENNPVETSDFHYDGGEELFMFDHNQHNFLQQYYRFSIMKTSVKNMIDEIFDRSANVNMALTAFRGNPGGSYVVNRFVNTNPNSLGASAHDTLRKELKRKVDALEIDSIGGTPINESMWEAKNYFRGEVPKFSDSSANDVGSMKGLAFISPMETSCQNSHMVLLSDGEPSTDLDANAEVSNLPLPSGTRFSNASGTYQCLSTEPGGDNQCAEELAEWLYLTDHQPDIDGNQNVRIHTVALTRQSQSLDKLKNLASTQDDAYEAENSTELTAKLANIMNSALGNIDTIAAPALSVSAYNSLEHRDQLYFALFEPNGSNRWRGNIKRYQIHSDGTITDVNGKNAVNASGGFSEEARSWWTGDINGDDVIDVDGDHISLGGFATAKVEGKATLLQPNKRKLYTWWGGSKSLSQKENRFPTDNNNNGIESKEFDSDSENQFREAMALSPIFDESKFYDAMLWLRGGNNEEPHGWAADVIHNSPVLINYFNDGSNFDDTLFVGSNLGFLHAINPDNGSELYSFMPKELLANGYNSYAQLGSASEKSYGLDAPMTIWRNDVNHDGSIVKKSGSNSAQAGEFIYLYQAMRRGGNNIYALDITKRSEPKILWQILGGEGDFKGMGQSWSVPQLTKIPWCTQKEQCESRDVLVFGGGYDPAYDDNVDGGEAVEQNTWKADQGSAIYIVDAKTGEKLWSIGTDAFTAGHQLKNSQMRYSMVANVTTVDINNDGLMDLFYAADIRGNLWRLDVKSSYSSVKDMISAGIIAQLSGSGTADKRRYFNAPDVALFLKRGAGKQVLAIGLSSGHRALPNEASVKDRVAVIMDRTPFKVPDHYAYVNQESPIRFSDLINLDAINKTSSDLSQALAKIMSDGAEEFYGIYLELKGDGEKAISPSMIFGGELIVTSFTPFDSSEMDKEQACHSRWGDGKLYQIDLNPFFFGERELVNKIFGKSESPFVHDSPLSHRGIPPMPQVYVTPCSAGSCSGDNVNQPKAVLCVGLECRQNSLPQTPLWYKTYWREKN